MTAVGHHLDRKSCHSMLLIIGELGRHALFAKEHHSRHLATTNSVDEIKFAYRPVREHQCLGAGLVSVDVPTLKNGRRQLWHQRPDFLKSVVDVGPHSFRSCPAFNVVGHDAWWCFANNAFTDPALPVCRERSSQIAANRLAENVHSRRPKLICYVYDSLSMLFHGQMMRKRARITVPYHFEAHRMMPLCQKR